MPDNGYKAVIYDCDGVIFDSLEANIAFYSKVMRHFGKPPLDRNDKEVLKLLHTYASRDVLAQLFAGDPRFGEALDFAGTIDYRELLPFMHMEQGFRETLDALRDRVRLAICTNRSTSMDMVLEHFGIAGYFGCVMTASRVRNPKPHPEPLLKILEFFGLHADEALFVGDSELDRMASEAAGVPFVAYKAEMPCLARIDRHADILKLTGTTEGGLE
ncbi:MAG TPA: HAD hydrolase-like protein [Geobacteraceae bacterium]|nr:HAD hydrolase-like protein [Geobacteraceae bacterium]